MLSVMKETFLKTDNFQSQIYSELKSATENESETYKEAITEKNVSKWLTAMSNKIHSLMMKSM